METVTLLDKLKIVLREDACPFFSDEELSFYLADNNNEFNETAYRCLILKSEDTTLNISGMNCSDTSKYFRRIAQKYRKNNSGLLGD